MSVFLRDLKRFLLVAFGGFLMALNIVIFVQPADLFPGGLTGITLLLQNIFLKYFNIHLPYSITVYAFNLIPVWIGFKFIGKRFTFFSVVMIFISGLFTDILSGLEWLHLTDDILLLPLKQVICPVMFRTISSNHQLLTDTCYLLHFITLI